MITKRDLLKAKMNNWKKNNQTNKIKVCKHRWRIGSWNGYFIKGKIRKRSLNIWCENCKSKHKAWLK
jgi:hypothetical protein